MIEKGQASPQSQVYLLQQVPPAFRIVLYARTSRSRAAA